jgi:hypothetical protein
VDRTRTDDTLKEELQRVLTDGRRGDALMDELRRGADERRRHTAAESSMQMGRGGRTGSGSENHRVVDADGARLSDLRWVGRRAAAGFF